MNLKAIIINDTMEPSHNNVLSLAKPAMYVTRCPTLKASHQHASPVTSTSSCIDSNAKAKNIGRVSCKFVFALMALPAITDGSCGIGSSLLEPSQGKFFMLKTAGISQV
jgi:hypothetical protein